MACASDYYAYCSQYSSGTPEVSKCMRANGSKLSKGCISALMSEGYVTQADIARHKQKLAAAKTGRKPGEDLKAKAEVKTAEITKPKAEPKLKVAVADTVKPKLKPAAAVAALTPPKPKLIRVGQLATAAEKTIQKPVTAKTTLALNPATYAALKNREARFVAAHEVRIVVAAPDASPATSQSAWPPAEVQVAASPELDVPSHEITEAEPMAEADEPVGDREEPLVQRSAGYPEGRMSLGREQSSDKGGFWSTLIEALSGHDTNR